MPLASTAHAQKLNETVKTEAEKLAQEVRKFSRTSTILSIAMIVLALAQVTWAFLK